jgi:ribA/ribD-fused uncharacterized protein
MADIIASFRGKYACLSNFSFHEVIFPFFGENRRCKTSEHAYQAAKCQMMVEVDRILAQPTPIKAKRAGRLVKLAPDWDARKVDIMYQIVKAKFDQNPVIAKVLIGTGDLLLIEGNTWGDTFWGMVPGKDGNWHGRNALGTILQLVRGEYQAKRKIAADARDALRKITK